MPFLQVLALSVTTTVISALLKGEINKLPAELFTTFFGAVVKRVDENTEILNQIEAKLDRLADQTYIHQFALARSSVRDAVMASTPRTRERSLDSAWAALAMAAAATPNSLRLAEVQFLASMVAGMQSETDLARDRAQQSWDLAIRALRENETELANDRISRKQHWGMTKSGLFGDRGGLVHQIQQAVPLTDDASELLGALGALGHPVSVAGSRHMMEWEIWKSLNSEAMRMVVAVRGGPIMALPHGGIAILEPKPTRGAIRIENAPHDETRRIRIMSLPSSQDSPINSYPSIRAHFVWPSSRLRTGMSEEFVRRDDNPSPAKASWIQIHPTNPPEIGPEPRWRYYMEAAPKGKAPSIGRRSSQLP